MKHQDFTGTYKRLSDKGLAERYLRRHDQEAFIRLAERYFHLMLTAGLYYTRDTARAFEICREALLYLAASTRFKASVNASWKNFLPEMIRELCKSYPEHPPKILTGHQLAPVISSYPLLNKSFSFQKTACLSKRQLIDLSRSKLIGEEEKIISRHLVSCPLCRIAHLGASENKEQALALLESSDMGFLKDYFKKNGPQIHLNGIHPTFSGETKKQSSLYWPLLGTGILFVGFLVWYTGFRTNAARTAQPSPPQSPPSQASPSSMPDPGPSPSTSATAAVTLTESKLSAAATLPEAPLPPAEEANESADMPSEPKVRSAEKRQEHQQKNSPEEHPHPPPEIQKINQPAEISLKENIPQEDKTAYEAYEKGAFREALVYYQQGMDHPDSKIRQENALMAARCYLGLKEKSKATEILKHLSGEGQGAAKRKARRLLRTIE